MMFLSAQLERGEFSAHISSVQVAGVGEIAIVEIIGIVETIVEVVVGGNSSGSGNSGSSGKTVDGVVS